MQRKLLLAVAVAASLPLGGCITTLGRAVVKDLTPEQRYDLAKRFIDRCGGSINLGANAGTGQVGGFAAGDFRLMGTCPTPQIVPLSQVDKILPAGGSDVAAPATLPQGGLQAGQVVGGSAGGPSQPAPESR